MTAITDKIGTTVTLRGRALDANAGAVLLLEDETPIYIHVLEYWPDEFVGEEVEVRGVLQREKVIPNPEASPVSHGAAGMNLVLRNASWRKIEPLTQTPADGS